jgi:hypothetical protein
MKVDKVPGGQKPQPSPAYAGKILLLQFYQPRNTSNFSYREFKKGQRDDDAAS